MNWERLITTALLAPLMPSLAVPFSQEVKREIRYKQDYRCDLCGDECNLEIHHKVPEHALLQLGIKGKCTENNGVGLCPPCHDLANENAILNGVFYQDGKFVPLEKIDKDTYIHSDEVKKEIRQKRKRRRH